MGCFLKKYLDGMKKMLTFAGGFEKWMRCMIKGFFRRLWYGIGDLLDLVALLIMFVVALVFLVLFYGVFFLVYVASRF